MLTDTVGTDQRQAGSEARRLSTGAGVAGQRWYTAAVGQSGNVG